MLRNGGATRARARAQGASSLFPHSFFLLVYGCCFAGVSGPERKCSPGATTRLLIELFRLVLSEPLGRVAHARERSRFWLLELGTSVDVV